MRGAVIFLALCFLLSLAGCASTGNDAMRGGVEVLEPQLGMKFDDIPLPSGFKFLHKDSYSFQSGKVRMAVLRYSGRKDADIVVNFFKNQMVIYDWNLVNSIEYGTRLLNFERDNESCIITIQPRAFNTLVTISLGPKKPAGATEEKPVK